MEETRLSAPPGRPPPKQRTEHDRLLLRFAGDHRFVLAEQVQALFGVSCAAAHARLRVLTAAGLLVRRTVFHRQPACYQVTAAGLNAAGMTLGAPRLNLACYMHDVGVGWVWLAARAGTFGPLVEIVSERQLRSQDRRCEPGEEPTAVRLGGTGPRGAPRLHYPDLVLRGAGGHTLAVELELTGKGRLRREQILAGYGADPRFDAVLYLADNPAVARALRSAASRVGVAELVHVQRFAWSASMRSLADAVAVSPHHSSARRPTPVRGGEATA